MSQFTEPLRAEQLAGKFWKILRGFEYHVGAYPSDEVICVPTGFITDFQSIPPLLWSIFGHPIDDYAQSGAGHDWLYKHPDDGLNRRRTRKECDLIFLEMNEVLGCPMLKRKLKYIGVRMFGWLGWRKYRKLNSKKGV